MGFKTLVEKNGFPNAVNNKGAVSPAILATANITQEITQLNPHGKLILKITL